MIISAYCRVVEKALAMSSKDLGCFAPLQLTSFVSTIKWLSVNKFDSLEEKDSSKDRIYQNYT